MQTRFRELSIGDRVSQSPRSTCTIYFYKFDKILFLYIDACRFLQQKWIICRETDCLTRGTSKIFISTTRERWTRWVCESLARQSVTSKFLRKTGQYYYTYYTTLGGMHMPFSTYNRARTFYWFSLSFFLLFVLMNCRSARAADIFYILVSYVIGGSSIVSNHGIQCSVIKSIYSTLYMLPAVLCPLKGNRRRGEKGELQFRLFFWSLGYGKEKRSRKSVEP